MTGDLKASAEQIARMRASGTLPPLPSPPSVWLAYSGVVEDRKVIAAYSSRAGAVRAWAMHYWWVPDNLRLAPGEDPWTTPRFRPPLFIAEPDVEEIGLDP